MFTIIQDCPNALRGNTKQLQQAANIRLSVAANVSC